ncbi:hypothetical protein [Desulfosporosinus sp. Sb-LF]|nr:hypothetical protein [Desulfosporosinus sp. Sb-LF]
MFIQLVPQTEPDCHWMLTHRYVYRQVLSLLKAAATLDGHDVVV